MLSSSRLTLLSVLALAVTAPACVESDPAGPANRPPTIQSLEATPPQLRPGETATVEASASDPDEDPLTYRWQASGEWSVEKSSDQPGTATVTAPDTYGATGTIRVGVVDDDGATDKSSLELSTRSNDGPYVASVTANPKEVPAGGSSDLLVNASDPDGEDLNYNWSVKAGGWSLEPSGQRATLKAPNEKGLSATVQVTVSDAGGATASASIVVSTVENSVPVISSLSATPSQVVPGQTTIVSASANDPDGDDLSYSWNLPPNWTKSGSGSEIELTAPDTYGNSSTVELTVDDGNGGTASASVRVNTESNRVPTITSLTASPQQVNPGGTVTIEANASDPLGDDLSYNWTVPSGWSKESSGSTIELTAPDAYGKSGDVQLVVDDGHGKQATSSVGVTTGSNQSPLLSSLNANPSSVAPNETVTIKARASDPNGDSIEYNWSVPSDWTKTGDQGHKIEVKAPSQYGKQASISVTVADGYGGETSDSVSVETSRNQSPIVQSLTSSDLTLARGSTADLEVTASDPNGDQLSYNWSVQGSGWSIAKKSSPTKATVTAPDTPDSQALVTVTVSDGHGQSTDTTQSLETEVNNPPRINKPSTNLSLSNPGNPSPISHSRTTSYQVQATDQDGDDLTYKLTTSTGASIDANSGLITWTPTRSEMGVHTMTLEVTDGNDTKSRSLTFKVGAFSLQVSSAQKIEDDDKRFVWGDFDGDGVLDAVFNDPDTYAPKANIRVSLGSSSGFQSPSKFDIPNNPGDWEDCNGLASGDLDGDGDLDVMTACEQSPNDTSILDDVAYAVWLNDGSGNFSLGNTGTWTLPDAYPVTDLELGDLDDDGDLDAAVSADDQLMVARNDGSAAFPDTTNLRVDDSGSDKLIAFVDIAIGDIRGGAKHELVVTYERLYNPAEVAVYGLNGSNDLGSRKQTYALPTDTDTPFGLKLADLDDDGDLDATFIERASDKLFILENDSGTFKRSDEKGFSSISGYGDESFRRITVADLDGDGQVDIAATFSGLSNDVAILFGDGSAGISSTEQIQFPSPYSETVRSLHATDWDGNGEMDLLFGTDKRLGIAY